MNLFKNIIQYNYYLSSYKSIIGANHFTNLRNEYDKSYEYNVYEHDEDDDDVDKYDLLCKFNENEKLNSIFDYE